MYPPAFHLESDPEKLFRVIDAYPLATLISNADDGVQATHVPLILDRTRSSDGTLIGHLDRNNPQCACLDAPEALAIFHGPDCYISPTVYTTDQLPTWNSVSVHVRGKVRSFDAVDELKALLVRMAERFEDGPRRFVLDAGNPHMDRLIGGIVGFEIEIDRIVGRFKLSQDKNDTDRSRAKERLIAQSEKNARELLDSLI